jgi:hypothetical protein
VKFSVRPSILLNSRECSTLAVNEGVNIPPMGQISPLGAKITSRGEVLPWGRGEVKNGPQGDPMSPLRWFAVFPHVYFHSSSVQQLDCLSCMCDTLFMTDHDA